ncbi:hypothetical protein L2E82_33732 [Cichorium intybus]|uniref:Uncharacterized protein n=1 Tax=Cichorium intybus TaxID=13427 RepID=A0ACB9BKZ1_CICIN|nr:hypothetical protein L2E82_33732 [Cichorium intybus]
MRKKLDTIFPADRSAAVSKITELGGSDAAGEDRSAATRRKVADDDSNINIIPSAAVLRQLAIGVETTRMVRSMKDLVISSRGSSHVTEKTGINFSIVKLLVLRDKEDKIDMEFGTDENNIATAPPRGPPYGGGSNRGEPRGNGPTKNGAPSKPLPIETPAISLNALNRITDNFGTKSLVGEGSYGQVFYGKLSAGEEAAVKKLDTSSSPEPDNDFTG